MGRRKYVSLAVCLTILIIIIGLAVGLRSEDQPSSFRGRDALDSSPLVDGHNDLPYNLYALLNNNVTDFHFEKNLKDDPVWGVKHCNSCFTDLPRLTEGKVGAQFWVAYVGCDSQYRDAVELTLRQIDVIKRMINAFPERLEFVTKAGNIEAAWKRGKIASMIGVEGGHSIDSSLAILRLYYELGARYLTLTHTCNTPWADASTVNDGSKNNLTSFGEKVVHEMNRLGMLVDLSHVSHNVMRYVLATTKAPVIFSHSSAFKLCNKYRNVPDDVLHMVKKNNGIVMVNFYSGFVNCNTSRNAIMQDVVDHINYIRTLIGVDHVGIGADYDGVESMPEGLEDVSKYPDLFDRLHDNKEGEPGWSKEDLEQLAGRNLIRVFTAVESVRDSMSSTRPEEEIITGAELYNAQSDSVIGECQKKNCTCRTSTEWKRKVILNTN